MKIFKQAEIKGDEIRIDHKAYPVIRGKHCIWIPHLEMKIIWSFNGKIESLKEWDKGRHNEVIKSHTFNENEGWKEESITSIISEYKILNELSNHGMAPPVNDYFYIQSLISEYPDGVRNCDCQGAYGYFIKDANKLEKGKYSYDEFKKVFLDTGLIVASDGARGDLAKPANTVNGYLVDVRKTIWDMMEWNGEEDPVDQSEFNYNGSTDILLLIERIQNLSQFPHKERKQNYQSYYLIDHYEEGSRNTIYRMMEMKVELDLSGKTVVDLGCQLGSMAMECYRRGARKVTGLEYETDYVDCARDLARVNNFQINLLQMDLTDSEEVIEYLNGYYKEGIDILFALSIYKHIPRGCFIKLLEEINWKVCYLESHNAPDGEKTGHVVDIIKIINDLDCEVECLGIIEDRSPRMVWRMKR